MGVTATAMYAFAAVSAASAVDQHRSAKKARKAAEENAAKEREALAALQQEAAAPIPLADEDAIRKHRRRSIASQMRRRGRASTILTDSGASDTLGA